MATSAVNRCPYCVVAHGALHRIYSKQPTLADQVSGALFFWGVGVMFSNISLLASSCDR